MPIDFVGEGLKELPSNSWVYKYLKYTENQESPTQFHIWSALSTIGSTLGRKCWIYRGYYNLYANQYIIIAAESARCRKSTSSDIAIDDILTHSSTVDIIREKMTTEFLCKELARDDRVNNEILIYAPELATFLGASAFHSGLIPLLTSMYNCPAERDYKTKESGVFSMKNVCINVLACTTLDWMSNNMPGDTIEGGFTGRVIFVVGEEPRLRNAWPTVTDKQKEIRNGIINDLVRISTLNNQYEITGEARRIYERWYNIAIEPSDIRLRPYEGRKGDHVLKIAMILSAAEFTPGVASEYIIRGRHIRTALAVLQRTEKLMHLAFRGAAFSKSSKDIDRILRQLEKLGGQNKWIQHSILLKMNAHYLNKTEFREVMDSLEDMKSIEIMVAGKGMRYRLK